MKTYFIISPAKDMAEQGRKGTKLPMFVKQSSVLLEQLKCLSVEDIRKTMKVSQKIAEQNYERYANLQFDLEGIAAIVAYQGLQYRQLHFEEYDEQEKEFLEEHIRILSGLYGILTPFTSIYPYRLEMAYSPFSLSTYWKDSITNYFEGSIVYDAASEEYGKVLGKNVVKISFKIRKNGRLMTQSTQVKKARGQWIHYVVKQKVEKREELLRFAEDGYHYEEALSDAQHIVFVKER